MKSNLVIRFAVAPTLAAAGVGVIGLMGWVWTDPNNNVPSILLQILLSSTFWLGINLLLYLLLSTVVALWVNTKMLVRPQQVVDILVGSIEQDSFSIGHASKWYVVAVGALAPLLYAFQAIGVWGDPWLPTTANDWFVILLYLVSQVPILLIALASLQIRWIYGVRFDDRELWCNFLWIHQRVLADKVLFAGKFGRLIFLIPRWPRIPIVVNAIPPMEGI